MLNSWYFCLNFGRLLLYFGLSVSFQMWLCFVLFLSISLQCVMITREQSTAWSAVAGVYGCPYRAAQWCGYSMQPPTKISVM